jgi:hypothetical protein
MSHHPEPISIYSVVKTLPEEPKNLGLARDALLDIGGDTEDPVWKRLEKACEELREATDEMCHLMEALHADLATPYDEF